jgi:hypothetical protein
MALKNKPEILEAARTEHRKESKKFSTSENPAGEPSQAPEQPENNSQQNTSADPGQESANNTQQQAPPRDEFKEMFDECFKGMEGMIAGDMVVSLIDDLKANFLFIYAKKNGIDLTKDAMYMDAKSKKFAAFCVDYTIKNKFFDTIKKYPLLGALGVFVISGGATFAMMQMMKQTKAESKAKDDEIERLKTELKKKQRDPTDISDVEDLNEKKDQQTETTEKIKSEILSVIRENKESSDEVRDFIKNA